MENQTIKERIEELWLAKHYARSYHDLMNIDREMCSLLAILDILETAYRKQPVRR